MINKTILAAVVVASMSFAPFVLAQVLSVTPETMEGELDGKAGTQDDPRMMGGPQSDAPMMGGPGGGQPGRSNGPQPQSMF